jgi:hypothetical protein
MSAVTASHSKSTYPLSTEPIFWSLQMKRSSKIASRLIPAFAILLGIVTVSSGAAINVPEDETSIQVAIDGAMFGDIIMLSPGNYSESLAMRGGITIMGTGARPEDTVLSGDYLHKILSLVGDARPARIENITLQDGFAGSGGAATIDGADVTFIDVHFIGNTAASEGGALFAYNSRVTLRDCVFYANYSLGGGGGAVHIEGTDSKGSVQLIEFCSFAGNSGCCGGTSLVMGGCPLVISNNILEDVNCLPGAAPIFTCNNGAVCGTDGGHNFIDDPMYCGFEYADLRLEAESPCLPENNPDCGLIGAKGACAFTAVESTSFSSVKSLYD